MKSFKARLKEKFDYDVSALEPYVDQQSEDIFTDLLYGAGLTSRINVMENVKGQEAIKLLNVNFDLQNATGCTLSDDGTVIFDDVNITTKRIGVQFALCNDDLNGTWAQMLLAIGANRQDEEMPLEDVITAYVVKSARKKNQDLMFLGDTTSLDPNLNFYNGFVKLWDTDATVLHANRTGVLIDNTNAFANFMSVYNKIPTELFDNQVEVEIITGRQELRALIDEIWNDKDYNAKLEVTEEGGELTCILPTTSVRIRTYSQLNGKNQIYAVPYQYMFFGTDLESDLDGFFIKFLEVEEKLRFGMKWRSGIQYVFGKYFVRLAAHAS